MYVGQALGSGVNRRCSKVDKLYKKFSEPVAVEACAAMQITVSIPKITMLL